MIYHFRELSKTESTMITNNEQTITTSALINNQTTSIKEYIKPTYATILKSSSEPYYDGSPIPNIKTSLSTNDEHTRNWSRTVDVATSSYQRIFVSKNNYGESRTSAMVNTSTDTYKPTSSSPLPSTSFHEKWYDTSTYGSTHNGKTFQLLSILAKRIKFY